MAGVAHSEWVKMTKHFAFFPLDFCCALFTLYWKQIRSNKRKILVWLIFDIQDYGSVIIIIISKRIIWLHNITCWVTVTVQIVIVLTIMRRSSEHFWLNPQGWGRLVTGRQGQGCRVFVWSCRPERRRGTESQESGERRVPTMGIQRSEHQGEINK